MPPWGDWMALVAEVLEVGRVATIIHQMVAVEGGAGSPMLEHPANGSMPIPVSILRQRPM